MIFLYEIGSVRSTDGLNPDPLRWELLRGVAAVLPVESKRGRRNRGASVSQDGDGWDGERKLTGAGLADRLEVEG